jgi:hypothetical protein
VLVADQTDKKQNGVYIVTDVGYPLTSPTPRSWILTRLSGFDTNAVIKYGVPVYVSPNTYYQTNNTGSPLVIGTDDITWSSGVNIGIAGGLRLPIGSPKDIIPFNQDVAIGAILQHTTFKLYPPSGGTINNGAIDSGVDIYAGDYAVCTDSKTWNTYYQGYSESSVNEVDVDSVGNIYSTLGSAGQSQISVDGLIEWNEIGSSESVCCDSDGTSFWSSAQESASGNNTLLSREIDGQFRFLHRNSGVGYQHVIQYDASETSPVQSGARWKLTDDQYFMANRATIPSCGRSATASASGIGSNYTVGFSKLGNSGITPASGTILIAILADNSNKGSGLAISGGGMWTQLTGGVTGYKSCGVWLRVCGSSEPLTYTVTYGGTVSTDSACCTIVEAFKCSSSNPDGQGTGSNTGTAPSATSTNDLDTCVTLVAAFAGSSTTFDTAPANYMLRGRSQSAAATPVTTAIAVRNEVGTGSISPGAWTHPDTTNSYLWTILLKP